ncbi:MAG TPA: outer membrane beta-barrel protein [Methylomirabilota bacterium]|nr:outer membrane beta-barrel protein [Methylomirabilota bacterium]
MKTTLRSFTLVVSCCFGLFLLPDAGRSQGFYLDVDAGVALAENVNLDRFLVPTPGAKIKLDPGARVSVAGGYNFTDYFGAQIETGFMANNVKSVTGGGRIDAALAHTPVLADVVLRYDKPHSKWIHYVGAGAGADVSIIALDHVRAPNGSVVDGEGSTVVFAWQAFAGVRHKITERISLGAGYKFFFADGASWDVRHTTGDIESDTARIHSLFVNFNIKF